MNHLFCLSKNFAKFTPGRLVFLEKSGDSGDFHAPDAIAAENIYRSRKNIEGAKGGFADLLTAKERAPLVQKIRDLHRKVKAMTENLSVDEATRNKAAEAKNKLDALALRSLSNEQIVATIADIEASINSAADLLLLRIDEKRTAIERCGSTLNATRRGDIREMHDNLLEQYGAMLDKPTREKLETIMVNAQDGISAQIDPITIASFHLAEGAKGHPKDVVKLGVDSTNLSTLLTDIEDPKFLQDIIGNCKTQFEAIALLACKEKADAKNYVEKEKANALGMLSFDKDLADAQKTAITDAATSTQIKLDAIGNDKNALKQLQGVLLGFKEHLKMILLCQDVQAVAALAVTPGVTAPAADPGALTMVVNKMRSQREPKVRRKMDNA